MGEIAEAMLDGTLCECCGDFIGSDAGFPQYCSEQCARDRGQVTAESQAEETDVLDEESVEWMEEGAGQEKEKVIAWLRAEAQAVAMKDDNHLDWSAALLWAANKLEADAHWEE